MSTSPCFCIRRVIPATDGTEEPKPSVGGSCLMASVSPVTVGVTESSPQLVEAEEVVFGYFRKPFRRCAVIGSFAAGLPAASGHNLTSSDLFCG